MHALDLLRTARARAAAAAAAVLVLAACGQAAPQSGATAASDAGTLPVVGPQEDRVDLAERAPQVIDGGDSLWTVELAALENSEDPVVVMEVQQDAEPPETHRLSLGGTVDLGADAWRLSDIAISDNQERPGSATLLRMDD